MASSFQKKNKKRKLVADSNGETADKRSFISSLPPPSAYPNLCLHNLKKNDTVLSVKEGFNVELLV